MTTKVAVALPPSTVVSSHATPEVTAAVTVPLFTVIVALSDVEVGVKLTVLTPLATDILYDSDDSLKAALNVPVVSRLDNVAIADLARLTTI